MHKSKSGMMTMHVEKNLTMLFMQFATDICLLSIRKVFTIRGLTKQVKVLHVHAQALLLSSIAAE